MSELTSSLDIIRKPDESQIDFQSHVFYVILEGVRDYKFKITDIVIEQDEIKASYKYTL